MKYPIFVLLVSFFVLPGLQMNAQTTDITTKINTALKSADAAKLANCFNSTIDLELNNTDGNFSKDQAEIIVKEFFKKCPVQSYKSNHLGSSNDGSKYIIGTYTSTNNKTYRVYILLKNKNDQLLINQLQFEEE